MYYTEIKHYLRLKEQRDDASGVFLVAIGVVLFLMISLVLMCL